MKDHTKYGKLNFCKIHKINKIHKTYPGGSQKWVCNECVKNKNKQVRESATDIEKNIRNLYLKKWRATDNGRYCAKKGQAKWRGIKFNLTLEEYINITRNRECWYCGEKYDVLTIDQIRPGEGYIIDNSAPCCLTCNVMKNDLSEMDFLKHIIKIYEEIDRRGL
jgi:hypothetical protein